MAKSRSVVNLKFDINEVRNLEIGLAKRLKLKTPEIARKVSIMAFDAIEATGNVPVDTGRLDSEGHKAVKDKWIPNTYIIGWTTEYAKYVYFGIHHEQTWKTINGKKQKFYTMVGNGMPFWDYPVTRNIPLMTSFYEAALKSIKELN